MDRRNLLKTLGGAAVAFPLAAKKLSEPPDPDPLPLTFYANPRDDHPIEPMVAWLAANDLDAKNITDVAVYGNARIETYQLRRNGGGNLYSEPGTREPAGDYVDVPLTAPVPAELQEWYDRTSRRWEAP